ncbi:MAG: AAA family ATPase, partial [Proteobacteria bacterium]|nr:AAA family ATPase [Pseudomonadota bacterium]
MTQVLAVVNQKGGVGKTTTSVNLSAALAQRGQRVLLVDADPQGNATMGSGVDKRGLEHTLYHVVVGLATPEVAIHRATRGGYDLLPANRDLAGAEIELVELEQREARLAGALGAVMASYDVILIDCPPSLSLLTLNALVAAQKVLIPMQCEYYALEGLSVINRLITQLRDSGANPALQLEGILMTMYD